MWWEKRTFQRLHQEFHTNGPCWTNNERAFTWHSVHIYGRNTHYTWYRYKEWNTDITVIWTISSRNYRWSKTIYNKLCYCLGMKLTISCFNLCDGWAQREMEIHASRATEYYYRISVIDRWKYKQDWDVQHIVNCSGQRSLFSLLESSWNVMAHGGAREGKWRGNWRMEWVASTLHTTSEHGLSSITTNNKNIRQAFWQHGKSWIKQEN